MTFTDGTTALGTEAVNTKTNTATLVTATLKGGAHSITAAYNGSGDDSGSTGTVNPDSEQIRDKDDGRLVA